MSDMREDAPENPPSDSSSTLPSKKEACAFLLSLWGCTSLLLTTLVFCIVFGASWASGNTPVENAAVTAMTACGILVLFGAFPAGLVGLVVIYARLYMRRNNPLREREHGIAEVL